MFGSLLIVVAVAFAAPFILGLFPRLRLPSVVLELIAGIIIGPSVLGIVHEDITIAVMALIGLAFLLFLAGLEIEFPRLRGQVLRLTAAGFVLSFAIALAVGALLRAGGLIQSPLLIAIVLCATSLGVLIPVLKDAGQISSRFGQLVIAADQDYTPLAFKEEYVAKIPGARLEVVRDARHALPMEKPAAFNAVLAQFLALNP